MTLAMFNRLIKPLRDRVLTMFSRGLIESTDDSISMQLVKLSMLNAELKEDVEHLHPYGLSSNCPTAGSEAIVGCVGGDRDSALAIIIGNSKYRIKDLASGEVCLYSQHGQTILLKEDGSIELTPKDGKAFVVNSKTQFKADIDVVGKITASSDIASTSGDVKAGSVTMKLHVHDGSLIIPTVGGIPGTNAGFTNLAQ
jgi:phage baseplate assembly protein V